MVVIIPPLLGCRAYSEKKNTDRYFFLSVQTLYAHQQFRFESRRVSNYDVQIPCYPEFGEDSRNQTFWQNSWSTAFGYVQKHPCVSLIKKEKKRRKIDQYLRVAH